MVKCPFPRRRRRLICCGLILVWICFMSAGMLYVHVTMGTIPCSDEDSKKALQQLCNMYREEQVAGNLCQDLCIRENVHYKKCLNFKNGKTVLRLLWNNKPIILKSKNDDISTSFNLSWTLGFKGQNNDGVVYPDFNTFRKMVTANLKLTHGYKIPEGELIELTNIWSLDPEKYPKVQRDKSKTKAAVMNSIWNLIQQDEYTFMTLYRNWTHNPRIYGSCGNFYAMEFVPPNDSLERHLLGGDTSTWKERVTVALGLLNLVQEMDTYFPQPMHMCDVKPENFGVSSTGVIKTIDTDMFIHNDRMTDEIMNIKNCTSHDECIFFDCKGWCDKTTKNCRRTRLNNNLQSVCEKLFRSSISNAYTGLLRNPPPDVKSELEPVLIECSNPWNSNDEKIRWKASPKLHHKLYNILKRSIS